VTFQRERKDNTIIFTSKFLLSTIIN
jgi:hypothetical protein